MPAPLARLHHGNLTVDKSEELASGAVFTLVLPVGDGCYTESERVSRPKAMVYNSPEINEEEPAADELNERPTVLVVDDDTRWSTSFAPSCARITI